MFFCTSEVGNPAGAFDGNESPLNENRTDVVRNLDWQCNRSCCSLRDTSRHIGGRHQINFVTEIVLNSKILYEIEALLFKLSLVAIVIGARRYCCQYRDQTQHNWYSSSKRNQSGSLPLVSTLSSP